MDIKDQEAILAVMEKVFANSELWCIDEQTYIKRGWKDISAYLGLSQVQARRHLLLLGLLRHDFAGRPFLSVLDYYVRFMQMAQTAPEQKRYLTKMAVVARRNGISRWSKKKGYQKR